jgi:ribose-phosphate pyrophosphokinase
VSVKLLVFAGSLRRDSLNKKLARVAARAAEAAGAQVTHIALNDYPMPIYDGDIEAGEGPPENAFRLQALIAEQHALIVVSPDVGGVVRARAVAKRLDCDLAIIDKRRPKPNMAKVMHIIGDVSDRTCIIMDDLVDTANTLCEAAAALKSHGARRVVAYITHPVLSGSAVERINHSQLDELVVTDTIPLRDDARQCPRIRVLTVAELLAETIRRISNEDSVSSLFME